MPVLARCFRRVLKRCHAVNPGQKGTSPPGGHRPCAESNPGRLPARLGLLQVDQELVSLHAQRLRSLGRSPHSRSSCGYALALLKQR